MRRGAKPLLISLLIAGAFQPLAASGQTLKARVDADRFHIVAPDLHLLSAEARQRLHDGASVSYVFRIDVMAGKNGSVLNSIYYHCVFSYDIWEEKYKVSRAEPGYRSASHLTESAAQDLCIESLTIPVASLSAGNPFWIGVEYRMEDLQSTSAADDSHSILGTFVEIFSQRKGKPQAAFTLQGGPFRVSELRKSP